jgi:hypothetical protein
VNKLEEIYIMNNDHRQGHGFEGDHHQEHGFGGSSVAATDGSGRHSDLSGWDVHHAGAHGGVRQTFHYDATGREVARTDWAHERDGGHGPIQGPHTHTYQRNMEREQRWGGVPREYNQPTRDRNVQHPPFLGNR